MPTTPPTLHSAADWCQGLDLLLNKWDTMQITNFGWTKPPSHTKRLNFNPALTLNWAVSKQWLLHGLHARQAKRESNTLAAWSPAQSWLVRHHGAQTHFRKIEIRADQISLTDHSTNGRFVFHMQLPISTWLSQVYQLKASDTPYAALHIKSLFSLGLIELRQLLQQSQAVQVSSAERAWLKIQDHLNEHYMQEIDRRQIAKLIDVHPNHLSRLFKRFSHYGFSSYLRHLRIQRACQYLKDSKLNLGQIAKECGLGDATYLIRCFKQIHHCTPGSYRSQHTQQD